MRPVPRWAVPRAVHQGVVVLSGWGALLAAALPDPGRPVLTAVGFAAAACVIAATGEWRVAGTVAVGLVTLTVLLAAVLDASSWRAVQVLAATVSLLAMVAALDRAEAPRGPATVTAVKAPPGSRWGPPALAVGSAALVSYTAARSVVPSVGLVLLGLGAAVAALVLATGAHRRRDRQDQP